jgi:hypothetical protein
LRKNHAGKEKYSNYFQVLVLSTKLLGSLNLNLNYSAYMPSSDWIGYNYQTMYELGTMSRRGITLSYPAQGTPFFEHKIEF